MSIIIGLSGLTLTDIEREYLQHPRVSGAILFSRNYQDREQLTRLCAAIHEIKAEFSICVDQEGGRVQRFRDGFERLPAAAEIGKVFDQDTKAGLAQAYEWGNTMARECRACGIDVSFAPVVDVLSAPSQVIGDRSFHTDPHAVSQLAAAYYQGMQAAGLQAVAKHFPGHGAVSADTHKQFVVDHRDLETIAAIDLLPYHRLIEAGIEGIMAAHVVYPKVDAQPVGHSKTWLSCLREKLNFNGLIYSDDLGMMAVKQCYPDPVERVSMALNAGCDRVLLCNDFEDIREVLC